MTLSLTAGAPISARSTRRCSSSRWPRARRSDERLTALDAALGGALARLLERRDFRGGRDETLHLGGGSGGSARVLLVGMGKRDRARLGAAARRRAIAARQAGRMGVGALAFYAGTLDAAADRGGRGRPRGRRVGVHRNQDAAARGGAPRAAHRRPRSSAARRRAALRDGARDRRRARRSRARSA